MRCKCKTTEAARLIRALSSESGADMKTWMATISKPVTVTISCISATFTSPKKIHPYVQFQLGSQSVATSVNRLILAGIRCTWPSRFDLPTVYGLSVLKVSAYSTDHHVKPEWLLGSGSLQLEVHQLEGGLMVCIPLQDKRGRPAGEVSCVLSTSTPPGGGAPAPQLPAPQTPAFSGAHLPPSVRQELTGAGLPAVRVPSWRITGPTAAGTSPAVSQPHARPITPPSRTVSAPVPAPKHMAAPPARDDDFSYADITSVLLGRTKSHSPPVGAVSSHAAQYHRQASQPASPAAVAQSPHARSSSLPAAAQVSRTHSATTRPAANPPVVLNSLPELPVRRLTLQPGAPPRGKVMAPPTPGGLVGRGRKPVSPSAHELVSSSPPPPPTAPPSWHAQAPNHQVQQSSVSDPSYSPSAPPLATAPPAQPHSFTSLSSGGSLGQPGQSGRVWAEPFPPARKKQQQQQQQQPPPQQPVVPGVVPGAHSAPSMLPEPQAPQPSMSYPAMIIHADAFQQAGTSPPASAAQYPPVPRHYFLHEMQQPHSQYLQSLQSWSPPTTPPSRQLSSPVQVVQELALQADAALEERAASAPDPAHSALDPATDQLQLTLSAEAVRHAAAEAAARDNQYVVGVEPDLESRPSISTATGISFSKWAEGGSSRGSSRRHPYLSDVHRNSTSKTMSLESEDSPAAEAVYEVDHPDSPPPRRPQAAASRRISTPPRSLSASPSRSSPPLPLSPFAQEAAATAQAMKKSSLPALTTSSELGRSSGELGPSSSGGSGFLQPRSSAYASTAPSNPSPRDSTAPSGTSTSGELALPGSSQLGRGRSQAMEAGGGSQLQTAGSGGRPDARTSSCSPPGGSTLSHAASSGGGLSGLLSGASTPNSLSPRSGSLALPLMPWSDWEMADGEITLDTRPDGAPLVLGSGAFGKVYRGTRRGVIPVAVKVLHAEQTELRHRAHFLREVALLRTLRDANVVQFLGACPTDDEEGVMLVTEFCPGGSLLDHIRRGKASWYSRGLKYALDVACGLRYLHAVGVVHMDIKSPNVLLDKYGTAKLADVGLAKIVSAEHGGISLLNSSGLGTFAWCAPEVLLNQQVTEKADIYSFGILLWELATGEAPIRGGMRPPVVPDECTAEAAQLIDECNEIEPERRPTAAQLVNRLTLMSQEARRDQEALRRQKSYSGSLDP